MALECCSKLASRFSRPPLPLPALAPARAQLGRDSVDPRERLALDPGALDERHDRLGIAVGREVLRGVGAGSGAESRALLRVVHEAQEGSAERAGLVGHVDLHEQVVGELVVDADARDDGRAPEVELLHERGAAGLDRGIAQVDGDVGRADQAVHPTIVGLDHKAHALLDPKVLGEPAQVGEVVLLPPTGDDEQRVLAQLRVGRDDGQGDVQPLLAAEPSWCDQHGLVGRKAELLACQQRLAGVGHVVDEVRQCELQARQQAGIAPVDECDRLRGVRHHAGRVEQARLEERVGLPRLLPERRGLALEQPVDREALGLGAVHVPHKPHVVERIVAHLVGEAEEEALHHLVVEHHEARLDARSTRRSRRG